MWRCLAGGGAGRRRARGGEAGRRGGGKQERKGEREREGKGRGVPGVRTAFFFCLRLRPQKCS